MSDLLRVEHVGVRYGAMRVLFGVDVEVRRGEIVALIGSNGAGKTTLLSAISGLVRVAEGRIVFNDRDITRQSPTERVRAGLIQVPERRELFPAMSVSENLELGALGGLHASSSITRVYELFPILEQRQRQRAATLSGGEQQMLALGRGLMARPELLMLDEPSLGLAPKLVTSIISVVQSLARGGLTVLLVEQNANLALSIADRAYVLEKGRVALSGTGRQLLGDAAVRAAYLGLS